MTSFVNLMAGDRWSESDIVNRTESMIAGEFPPAQAAIINRIVTAAAAGMYTLTDDERATVGRYNTVCLAARQAGDAARSDMALLAQILDYEGGLVTLDALSPEAAALAARRAPPPEIEPPQPTNEGTNP
jgi:hypothetical protein